jgi:hemerythrin-like metal-binding protein
MDTQHDYLYRLFDHLTKEQSPAAMKALLDEIEGMLDFHFTSEEHLIRHYKVPGFAVHQADHEQAAAAFLNGMADFDRNQLNPARLQATLTGWLSEHAQSADQQYAEIILKRRTEAGR